MSATAKQASPYPLRMPAALMADIKAAAKLNGRSVNQEIVARLSEPGPGAGLRDAFATAALQGMLAQSMGTALGSDPKYAAEYAYAAADAMLKARSS